MLRISLTKTACLLPLLALCLSGCGLTQRVSEGTKSAFNAVFYKKINTLHLDFTAREALNTDARENHSLSEPVVVRIYQLKDRQTFDRLVYQQLLEEGDILLAADLLASRDVVIGPGGDASSICRWKRRRRSWRLSACSAIRTHKEIPGSRCWRVRN